MRAFAIAAAIAVALAACNDAATTTEGESTVAPSANATAFVGTWAADAAGCAIPQDEMGAPHVFTLEGYDQHEAHCTFTSVDRIGDNGFRVVGDCTVEGDEQPGSAWDLTIDGDTMVMKPDTRLVRCPDQ
ncbi:MAG: hypothetical protein AB7Q23_15115 [Hyphomonadaceae bacterium]